MTVFCDNGDCCYIGEDGFCGCDKLSIVGGICAGSYRSGRNACDVDVDERLKAENAKLREQVHWLKQGDILHVLTDQELADQQKHEREVQASITALDDENAKLRELIRDMWHQSCAYDTTCERCPKYVKHWDGTEECEFETRIIKLGIEVGYEW